MANSDFFTYESLPYDWISSIIEKKDDMSISIVIPKQNSKSSHHFDRPNFSLKPMAFLPVAKKSGFGISKERRSKSSMKKNDISSGNNSEMKLSQFYKSDKFLKNSREDENQVDFNDNFEKILEKEIETYANKDLEKKRKQKFFI